MKNEKYLAQAATEDLSHCASMEALAHAEGMDPDNYAALLALNIRNDGQHIDQQRERLRALARVGGGLAADQAAADELARHFLVLSALSEKLALQAARASNGSAKNSAESAQRLTSGAVKAQQAALACLGAIRQVRHDARVGELRGVVPEVQSPDNGDETGSGQPSASSQKQT